MEKEKGKKERGAKKKKLELIELIEYARKERGREREKRERERCRGRERERARRKRGRERERGNPKMNAFQREGKRSNVSERGIRTNVCI